jgi:predicted alpha/beta-hydrolase family hydrolase
MIRKIAVELTATARCGFHKYTFPAADNAHIILDLAHGVGNKAVDTSVTVENDTTVSGWRIPRVGVAGARFILSCNFPSRSRRCAGAQRQRLAADVRSGKGQEHEGGLQLCHRRR